MKHKVFLIVMLLVVMLASPVSAALTYGQTYYRTNYRTIGSGSSNDPLYNFIGEVDDLIGGTVLLDYSTYTPTDTEPGTTAGMLYYDLSENKFKYYNGSGWTAIESGSAGNSLDGAYDLGSAVNVDLATVTLSAADSADVPPLTLAQLDTGTTKGLVITNAGTGNTIDISGTG